MREPPPSVLNRSYSARSACTDRQTFTQCVGNATSIGARLLLQIDRLIPPVLVELGTPNLVHALMFGLSEADWRPQANVDGAATLKRGHQSFSIQLGTVAFQGLYHEPA